MSQTTVSKYQDQWQKGQVATSHYVRDVTAISEDVTNIEFGELLVRGADKDDGARQPDSILSAVTGKVYDITDNVAEVTSAAHGLEDGQKILVATATPTTALNGERHITIIDAGSFSFPTSEGDASGTLDYSVVAFVQKDIKGLVVKPVSGGKAKRFSDGVINFSLGDAITLLEEGDIAIELGSTVEAGDDAYYVHTAGGASTQYTYRNDADTDKATKIPGSFQQGGVEGDIVMMRFNIDAVLGS